MLTGPKALGQQWGESPVLVKFGYGKGTVYHMISHLYLQRTETRDGIQLGAASEYLRLKNASPATIQRMQDAEANDADVNYGDVQAAGNATEFLYRALLEQKKRATASE